VKDAKALPPRKHTKTDTSVAEKEPRGQKSAEALERRCWKPMVTGGLTVVEVPASHDEMCSRHSKLLAEKIDDCLGAPRADPRNFGHDVSQQRTPSADCLSDHIGCESSYSVNVEET
jgi:hypothetical protein